MQSIKEGIVPQFETTQQQLRKYDEFVRKHAEFFISAVEGEGVVKILSSQVSSIEKRLEKIETQVNASKDRKITIVSVIIAIVSVIITILSQLDLI